MTTFAPARVRRLTPALPVRIGLALLAGLPGIATLPLVLPAIPGVPLAVLLANPFLMLALLAGLGAVAQARLPFRVRLFAKLGGRDIALLPPDSTRTGLQGLALGLAIALIDHLARGLWQSAGAPPSLVEGWGPSALVVGVLYGGLTEEILMRFGVVSLLALAAWRILARSADRPPRWSVLLAVTVAAGLFAAAHIPVALAGGAEPTPALVLRVLALNGVAGVAFGWLYVRRDLESAIIAHAAAHGGFMLAALAVRATT